jgi:hypothetical protein
MIDSVINFDALKTTNESKMKSSKIQSMEMLTSIAFPKQSLTASVPTYFWTLAAECCPEHTSSLPLTSYITFGNIWQLRYNCNCAVPACLFLIWPPLGCCMLEVWVACHIKRPMPANACNSDTWYYNFPQNTGAWVCVRPLAREVWWP